MTEPERAGLRAGLTHVLWKYVGTLVLERQPSGDYVMSLGRFFTTVMMFYAMYLWADEARPDLPDSMRQTLWILLGYNLGTQGIRAAELRTQKSS